MRKMGTEKTILVTGATGAQGGGVVDAILDAKWYSPSVKIKAMSRDASSDKAKALASKGVEVFQGDLSDKASLVQGFKGTDYIFLVTDFGGGAKCDAAVEISQGKNAVDAAKETGVKFVVFSTLDAIPEDVKKALPEVGNTGFVVPHFESKAAIEEHLRQSGVAFACVRTAGFYGNYLSPMLSYMKQPDGSFVWSNNCGDDKYAWHAVEDIGQTTAEIFSSPEKFRGKTVPVIGDVLSNSNISEIISQVTGETVKYQEMSDDQARHLPVPIAKDIANMWAFWKDWPYGMENRKLSERICVGPTFAEWASENKEGLLVRLRSAS